MSLCKTGAAGLVLALALAGAAHAAVLTTPLIFPSGTDDMDCTIVNVSEETRHVTIDIVAPDGVVASTLSVDLRPHQANVHFQTDPRDLRYCRFTVVGQKINFRAAGCIFQPDVGHRMCVPAQ